jgi:AraC-like DNA-binding protein
LLELRNCRALLSSPLNHLGGVMKTWKVTPDNPIISQFIDCYWYLQKSSQDVLEPHPKLIANPAMHLILTSSEQAYYYSQKEQQSRGFGCHILHPASHSTQLHHNSAFSIVGVKFLPGAAFVLTELLPQVIINQVEDFKYEAVCLPLQAYLQKGAREQKQLITLLDEILLPLCQQAVVNKNYQQIQHCLQLLDAGKSIKQLAEHLFCSLRTIERNFVKVTGLTVKQYQTMQRLETLVTYLHQQGNKKQNWADVAAQFGFSDQPHLIRYLKQQIGLSPNNYLNQRDLTIDVYGDFEN